MDRVKCPFLSFVIPKIRFGSENLRGNPFQDQQMFVKSCAEDSHGRNILRAANSASF